MREGYIKEMIKVIQENSYGKRINKVDEKIKKNEEISEEIMEREERLNDMKKM